MAYFMDFELKTGGATLEPRPETEILVEKAIGFLEDKGISGEMLVLDIGTGSGNIAISLTKYLPFCKIVALDISERALSIARDNAENLGVLDRIEFVKSNLFEADLVKKSRFDLIVSNPPYIPEEDFKTLPISVKDEPFMALYGGKDGLKFYRDIIGEAWKYLKECGCLLMEIGYNQGGDVANILRKSGRYHNTEVYKDYSGHDRVIRSNVWKN